MAAFLYPPGNAADWSPTDSDGGKGAQPPTTLLYRFISSHEREIALGELARRRGDRIQIRELGRVSAEGHFRGMGSAVTALVRMEGYYEESRMRVRDANYRHLLTLSGGAFDAEYQRTMLSNHRALIADLTLAAQGNAPIMREYADNILPVLIKLFEMAQAVPNRFPDIPPSSAFTCDTVRNH